MTQEQDVYTATGNYSRTLKIVLDCQCKRGISLSLQHNTVGIVFGCTAFSTQERQKSF